MAEKLKITRKDLKGPDEFITGFGRAVQWAGDNMLRVVGGVAIVLLVLVGILGFRSYSRWQEERATRDLWPHLAMAREVLQSPGQADEEKLARLEQFLTGYVEMNRNRNAVVYARYYLGSIAFLRKNYDISARQFSEGIGSGRAKDLMQYLLRQGLAQSLEAKGDFAGAASAYKDAATHATGGMKVQALLGQGRVLERAGRIPDAVAAYKEAASMASDDPETAELVNLKIARLQ